MSVLRASFLVGACSVLAEHAIQSPSSTSTEGPLLIVFPSAGVAGKYYLPTVASAQNFSPQQQLWTAIADGECAQSTIDDVIAEVKTQGRTAESYWLAGHGTSAACVEKLQAGATGVAFLGAIPSDGFDLPAQDKPTLVATAELQAGTARPGRVVNFWRKYLNTTRDQRADKPVVLLPGMNSSNFCPGFDLEDDLEGDEPQEQATLRIGELLAGFIDGRHISTVSTEIFFYPMLKALDLEHIPTGGEDVNGSSPFCEAAQRVLGGLSPLDQMRLELVDQFGPTLKYDWAQHENPDGTLMHCHNNNETLPGDKLKVKVCSYAGHDGANSSSSERYRFYDGIAAGEMGCKLMSSEFLAYFMNTTAKNPNTTCLDVNKLALEMGSSLATPRQLDRWQKRGRPICPVIDLETPYNAGPLWIDGTVNYTETESCLEVAAFHLKLGLDAGTGILDGVEYCKAMSPAFVLDYIMTGSMLPVVDPSRIVIV